MASCASDTSCSSHHWKSVITFWNSWVSNKYQGEGGGEGVRGFERGSQVGQGFVLGRTQNHVRSCFLRRLASRVFYIKHQGLSRRKQSADAPLGIVAVEAFGTIPWAGGRRDLETSWKIHTEFPLHPLRSGPIAQSGLTRPGCARLTQGSKNPAHPKRLCPEGTQIRRDHLLVPQHGPEKQSR